MQLFGAPAMILPGGPVFRRESRPGIFEGTLKGSGIMTKKSTTIEPTTRTPTQRFHGFKDA